MHRGLVITTESIISISKRLLDEGALVVYTHNFSQDSLESYFGLLRYYSGPKATAQRIILTQRALTISKIYNKSLPTKRNFRKSYSSCSKGSGNRAILVCPPPLNTAEVQSLYFMTGSIAKRILNKEKLCFSSTRILNARPNSANILQWEKSDLPTEKLPDQFFTFQKEFGNLHYTSPAVFTFIRAVSSIFSSLYPLLIFISNILGRLRHAIMDRMEELPYLPQNCKCSLSIRLINESLKCLLNAHLNQSNTAFKMKPLKNKRNVKKSNP